MACTALARVRNEHADGVELLITRKDQEAVAGLLSPLVFLLDLVDELPDEIEDAVARPGLFPEVARGVTRSSGRYGRVSGTAELTLVERKKARLRSVEPGRDVDELRIHREVGQTAAVCEERLARFADRLVLPHGVLDVLKVEGALQLRREDGNAVEEEDEVEARAVLRSRLRRMVVELARDGKQIRRVLPLRLFVESTGRTEVGEAELAARVLDAVAQHVERSTPLNLGGETLEKLPLDRPGPVMLGELLPFLRLGGQDEVDAVYGQKAE